MNTYSVTRVIGYGSRAITTTVEAPNMADALAMDRVMRLHDAEVAAGRAMDEAANSEIATDAGE